jgi:hypothetical protein
LGIVDGITWVDLPISFPFSKKRVFGNGVSAHVWAAVSTFFGETCDPNQWISLDI